ncbi:LOW QUALITY PROTEIN: hypothetical protein HID58_016484, partial [Brassica napus]
TNPTMVAFDFINTLRTLWPFSLFSNDLKESKELVQRLSLPSTTKNFIFAIRVPEHDSTIYILSAQNLSQTSATDAESLIRELRPDAVVAQVNKSALGEAQVEESVSDSIPTSAFRVLKQCFVDKVNKEKYESVAGILVLREIFGTSFNGHVLAAKRAASEVGCSFMVLESPFVNIAAIEGSYEETDTLGKVQGLANSIIPQSSPSGVLSGSRRFLITNDVQSQMLKLLSSHITQLSKELTPPLSCVANGVSSEVPPFAESIYSLLVDLRDIFNDLPSIRKALASARKMLSDVDRGESMDTDVLSEVYLFQIAVEGLRIALNNAGRLPIKNRAEARFEDLSSEEKSYALMADLLRSQAKRFKNIVAVVDASNLAGLRQHWRTCVPQEVKDLSEHMVQDFDSDDESGNDSKLKRLLSDKPVVAVGAGATAIWGASSLSKAISASPLFKIMTFKVPASLNLFLTHTHKAMTYALSTCAGLLLYGDGIECAAVSLPSAPSIAKLGRGIQNLREASLEVRSRESNRIQNAIEALRQKLKKADLLRSQAKSFKSIVAVVDASNHAGLRKHWKTCVPQEVKDLSEHMVQDFDNEESSNDSKLKRLLSNKLVVAVGASSLSKAISASPFFKIITFKVPASLNLFLTHTHNAMAYALPKWRSQNFKTSSCSCFASSGEKSTSLIRAVTHSIIASAENTSFSAMRAAQPALYEIMRRAKPIGALPLATFGASLSTCAVLLLYGDGIECAAVSLPSAPSIAKLGRGIQNLREASLEVRSRESNRIQNAIEALRQKLKKFRLQ